MITLLSLVAFGIAYLIGYITPVPLSTAMSIWAVAIVLAILEMTAGKILIRK